MEQEIIKILSDINPYAEFDSETDLFDNEILDSLGMLVLLSEIEKKYNVEISMDNLNPDNFRTVCSIERMVQKCLGEDA